MEPKQLKIGDIVQINPDHDPVFGRALMIVTEPKKFGAQGYMHGLDQGLAFYRCSFENMELVGHAIWTRKSADE
jgi:hypothetical protein